MTYRNPTASFLQRLSARFYYPIKPYIPRKVQLALRKLRARLILGANSATWPIDRAAGVRPPEWTGWPEGKQFALVLTHDVEDERGLHRCRSLAEMEIDAGFRSAFFFLGKKYRVPDDLLDFLGNHGFEVASHGLYHDGRKFLSRSIFDRRAVEINRIMGNWGAVGFRAPSMQCNMDWIGDLNIEYDASTFDTDPFEPASTGVGTIFPFRVSRARGGPDFVELPYTLPQDLTLFITLGKTDIGIWKEKVRWIREAGGMALVDVHPDYLFLGKGKRGCDEYPVELYRGFLEHLKTEHGGSYWHALPRDVSALVHSGGGLRGERGSRPSQAPGK